MAGGRSQHADVGEHGSLRLERGSRRRIRRIRVRDNTPVGLLILAIAMVALMAVVFAHFVAHPELETHHAHPHR